MAKYSRDFSNFMWDEDTFCEILHIKFLSCFPNVISALILRISNRKMLITFDKKPVDDFWHHICNHQTLLVNIPKY